MLGGYESGAHAKTSFISSGKRIKFYLHLELSASERLSGMLTKTCPKQDENNAEYEMEIIFHNRKLCSTSSTTVYFNRLRDA